MEYPEQTGYGRTEALNTQMIHLGVSVMRTLIQA